MFGPLEDRPADWVLPIFRGHDVSATRFRFDRAMGTGFLVAPGLLVTCWHCVPPMAGFDYAAVLFTGERPLPYVLRDIEQARDGTDLATARLDYAPPLPLRVTDHELAMDSEVATFGYPLTAPVAREGIQGFELQPRFLRGYVTRVFTRVDQTFGSVLSYELDMLAPTGLSGAPLFFASPTVGPRAIAGVVYGINETYSIAEESSVDPVTGEVSAEVRRMVSFALAHHTRSLGQLSGRATDGKPLDQYLGERSLLQQFPRPS